MQTIKNDSAQLNNLKQRQAAARPQIERIHKRNEIIAKIDTLKIKIPLARYTKARTDVIKLKEMVQAALNKAGLLERANAPMKKKQDDYETRKNAAKRVVERLTKDLDAILKKVRQCEEKAPKFEERAAELRTDVSRIRKAVNDRKTKIDAMRNEVTKLQRTVEKTKEKLDEVESDPNEAQELAVTFP